MNIRKKSGIITLLFAAGLLVAVTLMPSMGANPDANQTKSEKALEYISQKYAIPKEQLMIVNEKEANFPLSNQKIWEAKIIDIKSTDVYGVAFDDLGNIIDPKAVKARESAEHTRKYGKLEVDLYEKLQKIQPDEKIKVALWLTPINITPQQNPYKRADEKVHEEFLAAYKRDTAEKEKPVIDALEALGFKAVYTSQYAPLIYAEIPKNVILELEKRDDIDAVYISRNYKPELNSAAYTEKADAVWNTGITGSGIKVAIVEYDGIEFANPNLTDGIYYNSVNKNIGSHATAVAGVVASTNTTYKGIAYGVPGLLSANLQDTYDSSLIAATEWALNNGANILSNSYGNDTGLQMDSLDRYLDHLVWTHRKTVVKSSGDFGLRGNVTSLGLGYNIITVGAFDDMYNSSWSNDIMAWYSSFKDPISPHNDREKPEVVAVGSGMETTRSSTPWIGLVPDGTSLAALSVAGEAALLMQTKSWLTSWPETVKAVIMASAVHNLEGDSRLSDYDGAGGIDISTAYEIANNNDMSGDWLLATGFPKNYTFTVPSVTQKIRVAIVWNSHPDSNHPPTNDTLESDLDLYILDPNGNIVAFSTSYDNSYEIVEFTPQTTGTFKASVRAYRFDGIDEGVEYAKTVVSSSLPGWNYRKLKTITGSTADAQTNYTMKLTIYNSSGTDTPGNIYLGGNVRSDFGDLRFTKSDGVTLLDYWIESYTSGVSAVVWVEVDSIPASSGLTSIYVYYGDPSATSLSNGFNTFEFFDDFNRANGAIGNGWVWAYGPGSAVIENGAVKLVGGWIKKEQNVKFDKVYVESKFIAGADTRSTYPGTINVLSDPSNRGDGIGYALVHTLNTGEHIFDTNGVKQNILYGVTDGTWYNYKLLVDKSQTLKAKRWRTTDQEPSSWNLNYNGALSDDAGATRFWLGDDTGSVYRYFNNVRVRKYANPEPTWGT